MQRLGLSEGDSVRMWNDVGEVVVLCKSGKQELPPGFQRSEFLLEHGHVDAIVSRSELKETLAKLIDYAQAAR